MKLEGDRKRIHVWIAFGHDRTYVQGVLGQQTGSNRVNRGGSWDNDARNVRAANRNDNTPDNRNDDLGLRPVSLRIKPDVARPRIRRPRTGHNQSPRS